MSEIHASQTVHGGRVFALLTSTINNIEKPDRWDDTHTVHCGKHFAVHFGGQCSKDQNESNSGAENRVPLKQRGRVRKSDHAQSDEGDEASRSCAMLDICTDDALLSIIDSLAADGDIASICAVRSTCRRLVSQARSVLVNIPLTARVQALVQDALPTELVETAEKQAAAGVVRGTLRPELTEAVLQLANQRVQSSGAWTLSSEPIAADVGHDLSFTLRGFDSVPLSQREDVVSWHAEHTPNRPLRRLHLPCVLAGPPRYLSLAGSERDRRKVRRVPSEMCRVLKRPSLRPLDNDRKGDALIVELLRLAADDGDLW